MPFLSLRLAALDLILILLIEFPAQWLLWYPSHASPWPGPRYEIILTFWELEERQWRIERRKERLDPSQGNWRRTDDWL